MEAFEIKKELANAQSLPVVLCHFTEWVHDDTQDSLFIKFQYFIEQGVDPLFIIKTLRAKSDGMWHPRRKELLNANFITQ